MFAGFSTAQTVVTMDLHLCSTTFVDLNDDCLREVFQYLDLGGLTTVADVCHRFKQVAQAHFAAKGNKNFEFGSFYHSQKDLMKTVHQNRQSFKVVRIFGEFLESIHVCGTQPYNIFGEEFEKRKIPQIFQYCSNENVNELTLKTGDFTDQTATHLKPLLSHLQSLAFYGKDFCGELLKQVSQPWPKLENLSFHGVDITFEDTVKIIEKKSQLKMLSVKFCKNVDDRIIRSVAEHIPLIEDFRFENVGHYYFAPDINRMYLSKLSKLKTLELSSDASSFYSAMNEMAAVNIPLEHVICVQTTYIIIDNDYFTKIVEIVKNRREKIPLKIVIDLFMVSEDLIKIYNDYVTCECRM